MKQYKRFIAVMSAVTVCTVGFTGFDSIAAQPGELAAAIGSIDLRDGEWTFESVLEEVPEGTLKDTKEAAEQAKAAYIKKQEEEAARKAEEEAQRKAEEEQRALEAAQAAEAEAQAEAQAQAETASAQTASDQSWQGSFQAAASEQELLAALIYCEAGNQPYEGQVAVGAVVMNRVRSSAYPNTITEVIYQSGQFGPAMTGWLDSVLASGSYTDTAWQAAADALAGSNPIGDCMSFGNGNWGIQIGDHYFH